MANLSVTGINRNIIKKEHFNLCWNNSLPIQHLLDTISSIMAHEYIQIARENPDLFKERIVK